MAWERRFYRGNKVWILVDEAGEATLDERGHAQLRYKPEDDRTYTVRPEEVRPLEAGPGAAKPGRTARTKPPIEVCIHVGEPGPDGRVGIGILLVWRDRRRELSRRLPAASEDEVVVGAALEGLSAIRRPAWPVRVRCAAATRLEAIRAGAGTVPPACGEALRDMLQAFTDLEFLPPPVPASPDAERAARLAGSAPHR